MGGSRWALGRPASAAVAGLCVVAIALGLAGCSDEEDPAEAVTRSPAPPTGDLISTTTTIRPEEGYANLATTTSSSRGGEALIVGTVLVKGAAESADFRLTVNGEPAGEAQTRTFASGEQPTGGSVVAVYCACELKVGESDIVLEGSSSGGARVGARSVIAYTPAALERTAREDVISSARIQDETVDVDARGTTLVSTVAGELTRDAEKLLVLAGYRSEAESSPSPDVIRTEGLLDGAEMDEIGSTTFPGGKLAIFFSPSGAEGGTEVELRGFVTAGHAPVDVATIAVCPCDLEQ
jgi:hypothetical protein